MVHEELLLIKTSGSESQGQNAVCTCLQVYVTTTVSYLHK